MIEGSFEQWIYGVADLVGNEYTEWETLACEVVGQPEFVKSLLEQAELGAPRRNSTDWDYFDRSWLYIEKLWQLADRVQGVLTVLEFAKGIQDEV